MVSRSQDVASVLVADLRAVFGSRLLSVVAYGPRLEGDSSAPLSCLALVRSLSLEDLDGCARLAPKWSRAGLATPLILPEEEFSRSLDAFPLEYGEIVRAHTEVYGGDPFTRVAINREDVRRACETQVKSHLIHLRESFIETGGAPRAVADLVRTAAPAFAALLRNVARLGDVHSNDRVESTRAGARTAGLSDGLVSGVLALEHHGDGVADPARFFPEYLAAVERLAQTVDSWRV
jgi:hypothetical protein